MSTNPLDDALLWLFRSKVQEGTGYKSDLAGLLGLLDEGRTYMLKPDVSAEDQQLMTRNVITQLLTPALPPFFRLFMSGFVPSDERGDPEWLVQAAQSLRGALAGGPLKGLADKLEPGNQLGPWFYAPFLTSLVASLGSNFLLGPSSVNRRQDGQLGGLVVEKCAFLQESGCKGLCLNMCKLPAQDVFINDLGLALTVSPNFETQECQWSFGGPPPLTPEEDPQWPRGCLSGCPTRAEVRERDLQLACE